MLYKLILFLSSILCINSFPVDLFRQWHCVGISKNINFHTPYKFNIGELPLVAWKNKHNSILSTINICRHMGSKLHHGSIINGSLICPYHGLKHDTENTCGNIIEYQDKIWWSFRPRNKYPPNIPYYKDTSYVTQHIQIDMNAGLKDCALNSMDLQHPEYVHKGPFGFGSDKPISNFKTLLFKDRIGIHFEYPMKNNIKYICNDMNNFSKNFNMFIYPSTAWSKVNIEGSSKNLIICINMLPLEPNKTRWFVTIKHNFNNKNFIEKFLMKIATKLILYQDQLQFNKMALNNELKESKTYQFMMKYDRPIEYVNYLFRDYRYPDIRLCTKFIKMLKIIESK